jgi:hypothetical protein
MKNRLHFYLKLYPNPIEWKDFFLNDWIKNEKKINLLPQALS